VNYRLFGLPHAIRIGTGLRDFWKINEAEGRLWSDGAFMTVPFLVEYGILFGDQASIDEAAKQLLVYARHLQGPSTGLLYHAYDETGRAPWLEPGTRHSGGVLVPRGGLVWNGPRACARASSDACSHAQLLSILAALASGLERFQDSESGRWFRVMDRSDLAANWTETSCSSMHALILLRALDLGYLPARYWGAAQRAVQGVLNRVFVAADGAVQVAGISAGTSVGTIDFYLRRPMVTNDLHGLGAFLLLHEEQHKNSSSAPLH
jgi:unsaturated rhamnogalacturonyl hydrolase